MKRHELAFCLLLLPGLSSAQVVLDGSVGSAGPGLVAPGVDDRFQPATYLIHEGLGERAGANLFHSFSRFDVAAGETATFTADPATPTAHVLARVTGGAESQIHGMLRSTIPGADLWLINPAGWLFGAGASVDVPGSLHVTSADYVRDAEGTRFGVEAGGSTSFSIAPPEAFGFLDASVGKLTVENTGLKLGKGETLSLVGGDLAIRGDPARASTNVLQVPSGRINLVSVASAGEVVLDASPWDPQLSVDAFAALGRIEVTERARVDYSGDPGGTLAVRADSLLLDRSTLDGTTTGANPHLGVSADLDVRGETRFRGETIPGASPAEDQYLSARLISSTTGTGKGGSIRVRGDRLSIEHRARVYSGNAGLCDRCSGLLSQSYGGSNAGSPGDIDVDVGLIELVGEYTTIRANRRAPSAASEGEIRIDADKLYLHDGGSITTDALWRTIQNPPPTPATIIPGPADAGAITIRTGLLEARGFSPISANTLGAGRGGDIHIIADTIDIQNPVTPNPLNWSGIRAQTFGSGEGGDLLIEAREMKLDGKVHVSTNSYDPPVLGVTLSVPVPGDAGDVEIEVDNLRVLDGATITSVTWGGGDAGEITIRARDILVAGYGPYRRPNHVGIISTFSSRGEDVASAFGGVRSANVTGNAGDIDIETETLRIEGGTIISSTASDGAAGNVTIQANRILASSSPGNHPFAIEAESFRMGPEGAVGSDDVLPYEQGRAGNVSLIGIGPDSELVVQGNSVISARTGTPADGGHLLVDFDRVDLDGGRLTVGSILHPEEGHAVDSEAWTKVSGKAGDLTLIAHDRLRLSNGGRISAESIRSDGGNIEIHAGNAVELFGSSITAEVGTEAGAEATGGNISIDPQWVLLDDGSEISADAHAGNGGNISIRTQGLFVSPDSRISASSALGVDGTVAIDSPETNLTGDLARLSQSYLDAASLIGDRCAAAGRAQGSFALRDGVAIPLPADAALTSPLLQPPGNALARAR